MTLLWKCWQCAIPTGIFLRIPHGRHCRQPPRTPAVTSNTQWSLVYDDTDLTAQIVIRRKWGDVIHYDLNTNEIDG